MLKGKAGKHLEAYFCRFYIPRKNKSPPSHRYIFRSVLFSRHYRCTNLREGTRRRFLTMAHHIANDIMPERDAVASHGPIKSVICWLHPRVRWAHVGKTTRVADEYWMKIKGTIVERTESNLTLTHFVHLFDDISRVYLDNDDGLELQSIQLIQIASYSFRVFVQRLILPLPQLSQRLLWVRHP